MYLDKFRQCTVFEEAFHYCLFYDYFTKNMDNEMKWMGSKEMIHFRSKIMIEQHYIICSLVNILDPENFDVCLDLKEEEDKDLFKEYGPATLQESRELWESVTRIE